MAAPRCFDTLVDGTFIEGKHLVRSGLQVADSLSRRFVHGDVPGIHMLAQTLSVFLSLFERSVGSRA